jgi:decaprenyl-phosphate phosphoribosyltransferase
VTADTSATDVALSAPARRTRWAVAVLRTARPRQWPKNLLVFAAPLAGATLGRRDGLLYALVAAAAFGFASAAVYFVNDVADTERDRRHPRKRFRPVASGALPKRHAVVLGAGCAVAGLAAGMLIAEPLLTATVAVYLALSFGYSWKLKHVPVLELLFVASGFLLRVLGGAAATHVPPSGWFLLVCSLGALGVALAKRYTELTNLGAEAIKHRPVMRWYQPAALRLSQFAVGAGMIAAYLAWAASEHPEARSWHLASALPLAAALARFGYLTGRRTTAPVEDLLTRDVPTLLCEACWLGLFVAGLLTERLDEWKFSRTGLVPRPGSCYSAAPARSAWPS